MKIFLLFILTMANLFAKSQTSAYFPFPDSAIIWRQNGYIQGNNCCCSGSGPCLHEDNFEFFLNGDTTFGGVLYKKLLQTGIGTQYIVGPPTCPPWCSSNYEYFYYDNVYVGGIRQDTTQRKIFFIPHSSNQDTLLYDFNITIGDTLPSSWTNQYPSNYVTFIDSVLIGNNYHKRFWISYNSDTNYVSIIEGIGSSYGLLSPLFSNVNVSNIYNMLICVTINNKTVYPDTLTNCSIISNINNIRINTSLSIFPSPFSEILNLELNNFDAVEFTLYDIASRKLLQQTIINSVSINTSILPQGIYLYELRMKNDQIIKGKVIKE